jgi:hypothetical protein
VGAILGLIAVVCYQQQAGQKKKDDDGVVQLAGRGGGKKEGQLGKLSSQSIATSNKLGGRIRMTMVLYDRQGEGGVRRRADWVSCCWSR